MPTLPPTGQGVRALMPVAGVTGTGAARAEEFLLGPQLGHRQGGPGQRYPGRPLQIVLHEL